jgi:hypothetical protein
MLISADTGFPLCGVAAMTERRRQSGPAGPTTEEPTMQQIGGCATAPSVAWRQANLRAAGIPFEIADGHVHIFAERVHIGRPPKLDIEIAS